MKKAATILFLANCCLANSGEAWSAPFDDAFTPLKGEAPCYARAYDSAHLKAHPAQQITRMTLAMSKTGEDGKPASASRFELGVGVKRKASQEWYGGHAYCEAREGGFHCFLEADGGELELTPLPDGRLKVEAKRLVFEGEKDFFSVEDGAFAIEKEGKVVQGKSDDSVFLLDRAPLAKCRESDR